MAFWWRMNGICVLAWLVFAMLQRSAAQHIPGLVCNGTQNMAAHDVLRGKRLLVYETHWPPMGIIDESSQSGWRGFDIDLLEAIAAVLGFTYTVVGFMAEGNETWTSALFRTTSQGDLVMSYWSRGPKRMERVTFFTGHIDSSIALVARRTVGQSLSMAERMGAIFHRFTFGLWMCILAMILASGVVHFFLEKKRGSIGRLALFCESVYEYLAGTLWGGFTFPRTIASGVYQVVVAFLILVTVATYTANLTTFLTVSVKPTFSAASVDDAVAKELTVCIADWVPYLPQFDSMYPRLHQKLLPTQVEMRDQLATKNSGCDGAIFAKNNFDKLRMDKEACTLRVVQTVFHDNAGWATNQQSPCIQRAFDWALRGLELSGKIEALYRKWFKVADCSSVPGASSSSSDVEDISKVGTMRLEDFGSIFSTWGIATVIVIALIMIETRFHSQIIHLRERVGGRLSKSLSKRAVEDSDSKTQRRIPGSSSSSTSGEASLADLESDPATQIQNGCPERLSTRMQEMNLNIENVLSEILSLRRDLRSQLEKTAEI